MFFIKFWKLAAIIFSNILSASFSSPLKMYIMLLSPHITHAGPLSPAQSRVAPWDLFPHLSQREAVARGTEWLLDFIPPMYLALIPVTFVCPHCCEMHRVEDSWVGRSIVKWLSPSWKVFMHQRCKNFIRVKVSKHLHFLSMEAWSSPKSEK